MSKRKATAGIQSVALPIFVLDTSSTTGGGLAALAFNTANLVAEYRRQGQATWTSITLVAGTLGTFVSGGFVADGALAGAYEFCPPNAALAAGARWVLLRLRGAANMLPVLIEIELDALNYQDGVRAGLTALPPAAANAPGGLLVSLSGGLDMDELNVDVEAIEAAIAGIPSPPSAATILAAFKADSDWQVMVGNVINEFTYNPATDVYELMDRTNSAILATLILHLDNSGTVIRRERV